MMLDCSIFKHTTRLHATNQVGTNQKKSQMPAPMPSPRPPRSTVQIMSTRTVKPSKPFPNTPLHLTPWDLSLLSGHYIQKGLLFANLPASFSSSQIIEHLETSLAATLVPFYPIAGRFTIDEHRNTNDKVTGITVSVDCNGDGVELIHAVAGGVSVADVVPPNEDVPAIVRSLFPLDGAVNYDGHYLPLLSVQVTELVDGVFVGCAYNHALSDGKSYWNFFNAWAEIARAKLAFPGSTHVLSQTPDHDRWRVDGCDSPHMKLPFSGPSDFIDRYTPPLLREKMFHFSSESLAALKERANKEAGIVACTLSRFQPLSSLLWRAVSSARHLPPEQETACRIAISNRERLRPPISPDYFGNSIYAIVTETVSVGELLARGHGWAAKAVSEAVAGHSDAAIREKVKAWIAKPTVYKLSAFENGSVMIGSSPRFDTYGCDFGWGKAVAARSGMANKFDGKISLYPGWEGGGSIDAEVCLAPKTMRAIEQDEEFMNAVSPPVYN